MPHNGPGKRLVAAGGTGVPPWRTPAGCKGTYDVGCLFPMNVAELARKGADGGLERG